MYIRTRFRLALCALPAVLSGCNTIYVGDVPFKAVEICTEELASRLHPHSGCLPPTRAANAQRLYLARFRLEVSPAEAQRVIDSAAALESPDQQPSKPEGAQPANAQSTPASAAKSVNLLPSWIGRVFRVDTRDASKMRDGKMLWTPPVTDDMEFAAIGDAGCPPESGIATETLISTDLSGVVEKRLEAGAELDPSKVVDGALRTVGVEEIPGLRDALVGKVLKLSYQRNGSSYGEGRYYYVSMKPRELDSLTSALTICGWDIREKTAPHNHVDSNCADKLNANASLTKGAKNLVAEIQASADENRLKTVGIVIGVALLHTERGMSELCTKRDIGLLDSQGSGKGSSNVNTPNPSCTELQSLLAAYKENQNRGAGTPPKTNGDDSSQSNKLSPAQTRSLLVALSAEYSRAAYKSLSLHRHTSVLAIHWIPAEVPKITAKWRRAPCALGR